MNTKLKTIKKLMLVAIPTLIASATAATSAVVGPVCFYYNGILICV